jgi:hypothetical protein
MLFRAKKEKDAALDDAALMGIFSYALGIWQILRPGAVNRVMGVPDHNPNHVVQRLLGVREIATGTGVLFGDATGKWMWGRVAGDLMDIGIVGGQLAAKLGTRHRLIGTLVFLTAVLIYDAKTAMRLGAHR